MELDIEQLRLRIRESAAKRKLAAGYSRIQPGAATHSLTRNSGLPLDADFPDLKLSPDFKPRKDDHYHVNDLLRFHDTHFVRNAYRAILKRDPDDAGFSGYLERLRSGNRNKIDILASLRFSPEGRQRNVRVDGLRFPAAVRLMSHIPILGYFFQILIGILRIPNSTRERRRFESYSLAQAQEFGDHLNRLARIIREIRHFVLELPKRLDEQRARSEALEQRQHQLTQLLTQQGQELGELLEQQKRQFDLQQAKLLGHDDDLRDLSAALATQKIFGEGLNTQLADNQKALTRNSEATDKLVEALERVKIQISGQQARIASLLKIINEGPLLTSEQSRILREEDNHVLDALYVLLEDYFRGGRSEIKARFEVYLPYLQQAGINKDILDVGCGRGEWLELLSENGFEATGIDANRSMVEQCRASGLKVNCEKAIDHLRSISDQTLGAVTIFHVLEHLRFKDMVELVDEVIRTLRPGGLLVLETPNPENVIVGSCNFYFDPTHYHPLPIQLMQFLLEAKGLSDLRVIGLHTLESSKVQGDSELINRFNEFFYGPMDYAIVATRN